MLIAHTSETARHDWPEGTFIQGGGSGLVLSRNGNYHTAFVEVNPADMRTFIRGEGATIPEAEDAAWATYRRNADCPGHEFEPRGYTNGAGFCKHCGMFSSHQFTAEQLGLHCAVCGTPANWCTAGGKWFCENHAPTREERRVMNAVAGTPGGMLEELFDRLAVDD